MKRPYYVTTPIYYANDKPHIGHAHTTVLGDVLARYARLRGMEPFFLTGTDEHGQKVLEAAQRRGVAPQEQADEITACFRDGWKRLDIAYDDFIRTTERRHIRVVEAILQRVWEQGDIYLGRYEGWYCVADEVFWTEKDVPDGNCPECDRPVERLTEPNYFFRMSAYQDWLVQYIHAHPLFIQPEIRRNEVLSFLRQPLTDLCISRPVSRLSWGIPLPFDTDYVTYVWFDALINYLTAAGYLSDDARFAHLWSSTTHLIAKDILRQHAVYWPTMLQAAGLPQPRTIFAHGWWKFGGNKMSKSRGNVVKPLELAKVYGADALRYFIMRDMPPNRDADFDLDRFDQRYQSDLANDLGNLLHRLVNMIGRYCNGCIPDSGNPMEEERELRQQCLDLIERVFAKIDRFAVNEALAHSIGVVGEINGYLERTAPWKQSKAGQVERVRTSLYTAAEALRLVSLLLYPVMPGRMSELWHRIGWQPPTPLRVGLEWGELCPGNSVVDGPPLFPREIG